MLLVKALGVGMALAVLLDATLVRGLLVPATMRLLGDANWWWPWPFNRLLPANTHHVHRSSRQAEHDGAAVAPRGDAPLAAGRDA
jgi:RND superfamily putative drug exporter